MAYMNVKVFYEGADYSDYLISYDREKNICTGIGTAKVSFDLSRRNDFGLYKVITIYENDLKRGTFYIATIEHSIPESTVTLICQDGSKKLQDYYIDKPYFVNYPSLSHTWIEKFANEAGISVNFSSTSSTPLPNDTYLGTQTAYEQIMYLLQINGWFMRFDANNLCLIGKFDIDVDTFGVEVHDDDIQQIHTTADDKMYRNKAIIYGMGSPTAPTGWVHASLDLHGQSANEYDNEHDIRPIVMGSSYIEDNETAYGLASQMMKEFHRITETCYVEIIGIWDLDLGTQVFVNSTHREFGGTVTSLTVSFSREGIVTAITLNQRCPRLFGYFNYGGYVYAGTESSGIWRKHLKWDHTWTSFNTGLLNNHIYDLKVFAGVFTCNAGEEAYVRNSGMSAWVRVVPSSFTDSINNVTYSYTDVVAGGVNINTTDYSVDIIYTNINANVSWVVKCRSSGTIISTKQIKVLYYAGERNIRAFDVDNFSTSRTVTGVLPGDSTYVNVPASGLIWQKLLNVEANKLSVYQDEYFKLNVVITGGSFYITLANKNIEFSSIISNWDDIKYSFNYSPPGITLADDPTITHEIFKRTGSSFYFYMLGGDPVYYYIVEFSFLSETFNLIATLPVGEVNTGSIASLTGPFFGTYYLQADGRYIKNYLTNEIIIDTGTKENYSIMTLNDHFFMIRSTSGNNGDPVSVDAIWFHDGISQIRSNILYLAEYGTNRTLMAVESDLQSFAKMIFGAGYVYQDPPPPEAYEYSYVLNLEDYSAFSLNTRLVDQMGSVFVAPTYTTLPHNISAYENYGLMDGIRQLVGFTASNNYLFIDTPTAGLSYLYIKNVDTEVTTRIYGLHGATYPFSEVKDEGVQVPMFYDHGMLFREISESSSDSILIVREAEYDPAKYFGAQYLLAKESGTNFEITDYTTGPTVMELDTGSPLITYPLPWSNYLVSGILFGSGVFSTSGTLFSGGSALFQGAFSDFRYSFTLASGDLHPLFAGDVLAGLPPSGYVLDARVMYQFNPSGIYGSGEGSLFFTIPFILSTAPSGIVFAITESGLFQNTLTTLTQISGYAERIETTNYQDYPYIFISFSGDRTRFLQRDGFQFNDILDLNYYDRTGNLPNSKVTIIRCDDRI